MKERALARLNGPDVKIQRYRAPDSLINFRKPFNYVSPKIRVTPGMPTFNAYRRAPFHIIGQILP